MYRLEVKKLFKNFGFRKVLRDVSFELQSGQSLAITGRNGSGKTTLLRLLAGLASPTRGEVIYYDSSGRLNRSTTRQILSYVGPEMTLYDPLTAEENLRFFATMRGVSITSEEIKTTLKEIGLKGRGKDKYGAYSSGMKQRLKYAVALLNKPAFLLLDEPTSNLDDDGKNLVSKVIERQKENGILIIATNEKEEYGIAEKLYQLNS
ncbi:MAG: heme ABC exporter ATP-binding protein CcmA [candidate division Zixibacteria bacterium]